MWVNLVYIVFQCSIFVQIMFREDSCHDAETRVKELEKHVKTSFLYVYCTLGKSIIFFYKKYRRIRSNRSPFMVSKPYSNGYKCSVVDIMFKLVRLELC